MIVFPLKSLHLQASTLHFTNLRSEVMKSVIHFFMLFDQLIVSNVPTYSKFACVPVEAT